MQTQTLTRIFLSMPANPSLCLRLRLRLHAQVDEECVEAVKQVDSKLRVAQRAELNCQEAKKQTTEARNRVVTNARGATSTTDNLLREVAGILETCFNASQDAENAKLYANTVAAATLGEMKDAYNLTVSVKNAPMVS
jgi:hypothetical protein